MDVRALARRAIRVQGWYYLLGGIWPLVNLRSFAAVAGPKPDPFQTEVAAVLFTAAGSALLASSRQPHRSTVLLSRLCALGSLYAEFRHRREIRPIFLADASLHTLVLLATAAPDQRKAD